MFDLVFEKSNDECCLYGFNNGDLMWKHFNESVNEESFVLWNDIAAMELFVRNKNFFSDNHKSFDKVFYDNSNLPSSLSTISLRHTVKEWLESHEDIKWKALSHHKGAIDEILLFLQRLDEENINLTAENENEKTILCLKEFLKQNNFFSRVSRWQEISTQEIETTEKTIYVAPTNFLTEYQINILKNLAENNNVNIKIWFASNFEEQQKLAEKLNFTLENKNIENQFVDCLFKNKTTKTNTHQFIVSNSPEEQAIDALYDYNKKFDLQEIALIMPSIGDSSHIAELAGKRGLNLYMNRIWKATDIPLGSLFLSIARNNINDLIIREEIIESSLGQTFNLLENDIEEIRICETLEEQLLAVHKLGQELLERTQKQYQIEDFSSWLWLDGLALDIAGFKQNNLWPEDLEEALMQSSSAQQTIGDPQGIRVLRYNQAASVPLKAAVFLGLEENVMPEKIISSPFLSKENSVKFPQIENKNIETLFIGAVANTQNISFVSTTDKQSSYFLEAYRAAEEPGFVYPSANYHRTMQKIARKNNDVFQPKLQKIIERTRRENLPKGFLGGTRTRYSVTELEQYLRCPYGWFVSSVLSPHRQSSQQARIGQFQHDLLDKTLTMKEEERNIFVEEKLQEKIAEKEITGAMAVNIKHKINNTLLKYSGNNWPFSEHICEKSLSYELIPGYTIHGRVDRIDHNNKELLVIDYKNRRAPQKINDKKRQEELQRYIYPMLASKELEMEPLGAVYISLFHNTHDGSLTKKIAELDSLAVDYSWNIDSEHALKLIAEAINSIEQGNYETVGHNCPKYCPHHLLSKTIVC